MSTRPNRETAYRVFAREFDDASLSYAESDEERAPNYVVTPTGARINRLFVVGVLTEIESVNEEQLRARIVDPTGAFVVYAGQYQPEALSFLERVETPAFIAVTGKARTFQPEDSNRVFTSIRPETLSEVDAATRDRFVVDTAARTTERVRTMQDALSRDERDDALRDALESEDVEAGLAAGIPRALEHYGTTQTYLDALGEMALDAARVVAGEREEVPSFDVAPDEGDSTDRTAPVDAGESDVGAEPADSAVETDGDTIAETGGGVAVSDDSAIEGESADGSETVSSHGTETTVEPESTAEIGESVESEATQESSEAGSEDAADESLEATDEPTSERADVDATDGESGDGSAETATESDLDPEEFELEDEVREHIEDTYGTDFESAADVGEPGEAGIETPTPEESSTESSEESESTGTADTETAEPTDTETTDGTETAELGGVSEESDADTGPEEVGETETDPEDAVVTAMRELDEGDGAEREAVIESVVESGLTREEAEDGIQSALMSGECYEPDDDTLKPI